jgi:NAD+ synthase/NAD+ synthase (glutamine-hydrolysing)
MKIALLQVNPVVGDLAGNARQILDALKDAAAAGATLAATPELALVGYLPRDLLLSSGFVRRSWDMLAALARDAADLPPVLVGLPEPNPSDEGRPLFNSAVLLRNGRVDQRFRKALLPTYDVFDEDR